MAHVTIATLEVGISNGKFRRVSFTFFFLLSFKTDAALEIDVSHAIFDYHADNKCCDTRYISIGEPAFASFRELTITVLILIKTNFSQSLDLLSFRIRKIAPLPRVPRTRRIRR